MRLGHVAPGDGLNNRQLVQGWFALIGHRRSSDPYFLYAASNAGSLLALLCYPFAIEPNLGLITQSRLWKTGFLILAILVVACGLVAQQLGRVAASPETRRPPVIRHWNRQSRRWRHGRCGSPWCSYRQAG